MIADFKNFVSKNPGLLKYVKEGSMTWQKFYEMYDLYGEKEEVWREYISLPKKEVVAQTATQAMGFTDILTWLKTADLSKVEEGINSVQRVIGVLQDLGTSGNSETKTTSYKPRPLYKHFED